MLALCWAVEQEAKNTALVWGEGHGHPHRVTAAHNRYRQGKKRSQEGCSLRSAVALNFQGKGTVAVHRPAGKQQVAPVWSLPKRAVTHTLWGSPPWCPTQSTSPPQCGLRSMHITHGVNNVERAQMIILLSECLPGPGAILKALYIFTKCNLCNDITETRYRHRGSVQGWKVMELCVTF